MIPEQILLLVSILTPIISGVVELIKHAGLKSKYAPIAAVVAGMLLGLAYVFGDISIPIRLWAGGLAGLAAGGFYSNIKEPIKNK
jgi:hypothetical protein